MKKLSISKRNWLIKRQRSIEKRRRRSIKRKILPDYRTKNTKRRMRSVYVKVRMPQTITIGSESSRFNTLDAIKKIREAAKSQSNVVLDFSETKYAVADGMLILYAELLRLKKHFGSKFDMRCRLARDCVRSRNRPFNSESAKVAQVLKHVGILDLLGNKTKITPSRSDVVNWQIAHGAKSEGQKSEPILEIVDRLLGKAVSKNFYTGITEAMTNSHHHAYEDIRDDNLHIKDDSGWWLFSQVKDDKLSILICDLGIGIPNSLKRTHESYMLEIERRRHYIHRDSLAIEHATQTGSTSTDLPNRGKGLKKMIRLVRDIPGASLAIYSNHGAYYCDSDSRISGFIKKDFDTSILGTLIYWSVDLNERKAS